MSMCLKQGFGDFDMRVKGHGGGGGGVGGSFESRRIEMLAP